MLKTLIIGAQNIDIFAQTTEEYSLRDSNLAKIHIAFGGVGRNIVENVKRMGNDVAFLSIFGDDDFSKSAKNSLVTLGVELSGSRFLNEASNSVYLGVMDQDNDLYLGLNDMEIVKDLNPAYLKTKAEYINSFSLLVIDNNLSKEAITYLLTTYQNKTIIMDAVSAKKVGKLKGLLQYIDLLKVNQIELDELSKVTPLKKQLEELHKQGIKQLLVTNQAEEIMLSSKDYLIKTTPIPCETIVNASGAGDAFISGFVHGMIHHLSDEECLTYAKKVAYLTLLSNNSTNNKLTKEKVEEINE